MVEKKENVQQTLEAIHTKEIYQYQMLPNLPLGTPSHRVDCCITCTKMNTNAPFDHSITPETNYTSTTLPQSVGTTMAMYIVDSVLQLDGRGGGSIIVVA